jgi:hypothetical protein
VPWPAWTQGLRARPIARTWRHAAVADLPRRDAFDELGS